MCFETVVAECAVEVVAAVFAADVPDVVDDDAVLVVSVMAALLHEFVRIKWVNKKLSWDLFSC